MEQPKRDPKESEGVNERLEAAKGGLSNVQAFTKDTVNELKKVQWPSRRQVMMETIVVLATVAIVVLLVNLFDFGLGLVADRLFAAQ